MPKFLLAYHGMPDLEAGVDHMAAWKAWIASLGDAVIDPGMPVGASKTVTPETVIDNGGPNPLSGITILAAETLEKAIEMTKACPHLSGSGTIEVAEAIEM